MAEVISIDCELFVVEKNVINWYRVVYDEKFY